MNSTLRIIPILLPSLASAAEKVTFDDQVLPIFEQSCLNCHNPDKTKGGLDLSSFTATLKGSSGGKIVEPGDLGSSLITVVLQTSEPKMPPEGDALPKEQITILKQWIEGGLLENSSSSARKPNKPKFDASLKADSGAKPEGPPPMPEHVLLEPGIVTPRTSAIFDLVASPWAPLLAVTGQRQVLLYHSESRELVGILPFPEGDPVSLAFTPNARYLIVGGGIPGKSGLTVTFDITTGQRVLVAGKEFDTVLATDLSPDLGSVATGSPSRLIKLWKTEDGSQINSIKKHTDWVTSLDFSPDGILLATGDRNGGVWVWEAGSGNEFHTLRAHQAGITSARFRADSNVLATASEDGSVRFWEMNNGKEIKKIDAHSGGVLAFSWARDGSFATAGRDKKIKLWKPDFASRREIKGLPDIATAVSLDAEGKMLFSADFSGIISVYRVDDGKKLGEFDPNPPLIATRLLDLRQQIDALPERIQAAKAKRDQTSLDQKTLQKRIKDAELELQQAQSHIETAGKALNDREQQLKKSKQQRDKLEETSNRKRAELAEVENKIRQAETALQTTDKNVKNARSEEEATRKKLDELEAQNESPERTKQLERTRQQLARHQAHLKTLVATQQSEKNRINPQRAGLEKVRKDLDQNQTEAKELTNLVKTLPTRISEAKRSLEAAQKRPQQIKKQLTELREQLKPGEKSIKESEQAFAKLRQQLEDFNAQEQRWTAAAINAEALSLESEASAKEQESEALADRFSVLTRDIETRSTALAEIRRNRAETLKKIENQGDQAADTELSKTLEALEKAILNQSKALGTLEAELLELRRELDELLPEAHELRAKAEDAKNRYLATQAVEG